MSEKDYLANNLPVLPLEACRMWYYPAQMRKCIAHKTSIWTHHMKQFKIHQSFQPSNCSSANSHMAATVGAGIQDGELLDQLAKRNLTAVAGTSMVRACALRFQISACTNSSPGCWRCWMGNRRWPRSSDRSLRHGRR